MLQEGSIRDIYSRVDHDCNNDNAADDYGDNGTIHHRSGTSGDYDEANEVVHHFRLPDTQNQSHCDEPILIVTHERGFWPFTDPASSASVDADTLNEDWERFQDTGGIRRVSSPLKRYHT